MAKFRKIVVVDYTGLTGYGKEQLKKMADEVVFFDNLPADESELVRRIGDADALLVSYNTRITENVIVACPALRYIGMCCTLYSEASANVDIAAARKQGIPVLGIKDYGDEGVVEYVISELVRLLHGFGPCRWKEQAYELTGQKIGIIGLGRTGFMIAEALKFLGARVTYYSRTRKPEAEQKGIEYLSLPELLQQSDIVGTCLPRNTILLNEKEFRLFGSGKILFNTSVGITFCVSALENWLRCRDNYYLCDQVGMGDCQTQLAGLENVLYVDRVAGHSAQCMDRLSEKVIQNIESLPL